MVFQFYALYPHLSVKENIAFPLRSAKVSAAEIETRVTEVASRMNLMPLLKRFPKQLAGGDQQRVSLARAIVRHPKLYLMDEPLGTLDADRRADLRELIRAKQLEQKVTTLYVTHDQEEAMSLADRVVVMSSGQIRQVGTPREVYDRPADLFVANFVGSPGMNFVDGQVENGDISEFVTEQGAVVPLPERVPAGKAVLGIRSEYLSITQNGPVHGRVALQEYLGSCRSVHVDAEFGRLVVRVPVDHRVSTGELVHLTPSPGHINLFNAQTELRL
jgi:ABC-type sugar transport system ATPase subunit